MDLMDEVVDICSSGMGGELSLWHVRELQKAFSKHLKTDQEREAFFTKQLVPYMMDSEGWMLEDIFTIKSILNIEKDITITI